MADPRSRPPPEALDEGELRARFVARGIPLTIQRRAILAELQRRADHPSAEGIYEGVAAELPGLSRATVYRTLETLVELGLAARIAHPGAAVRYDPKPWRHHHLLCEGCGAVLDVELPELEAPALPASSEPDFVVRDWSVQFVGLCARCSARPQSAAG